MTKRKKSNILIILFLLMVSSLSAQIRATKLIDQGYSWTTASKDPEEGESLVSEESTYSSNPLEARWERAEIQFLKGLFLQQDKQKKESLKIYEDLLTEIDISIEKYDNYRFLEQKGIVLAQWMSQKGIRTIIKTGPIVLELAEEAVKKAPTSYRANLLLAQSYLNAPGFAGGDPKKGLKTLGNIDLKELKPYELFQIHYGEALGYYKIKQWQLAKDSIVKGLKLFPSNQDAISLEKKINKKIK